MKKSIAKNGGKRAGAGRKKGTKLTATLDKIAARELVRLRVTAALAPLVDAQIANAVGLKYLVTREAKTGKFVRVTEAMARTKIEQGFEIIEVWEKDPSVAAFSDLLNRALDRPKEQEIEVKLTNSADARVARLVAARKRTT